MKEPRPEKETEGQSVIVHLHRGGGAHAVRKETGEPAKKPRAKKITPRGEAFCQGVVSGLSQTEAYRKAFGCAGWKPASVQTKASEYAARSDIRARIEELQAPVLEAVRAKAKYELEDALSDCDEAIAIAKETMNPSAMVSAVALKTKIMGLQVEDRENQRRPFGDLTVEELNRRIESLSAKRAASK